MPYFSRSQLGVILLLGALFFCWWGWRENWGRPDLPPREQAINLTVVEVGGDVARPGIYTWMRPPQLSEVWRQAGGPKPEPEGTTALESGNRVEISREGNWQVMQMDGERLIIMGLPIDINRASSRDLEALPGVGPTLAGRIIKHRQEFGPFKTIDDLEQVSGLGPKKLDQIKAYIIAKE